LILEVERHGVREVCPQRAESFEVVEDLSFPVPKFPNREWGLVPLGQKRLTVFQFTEEPSLSPTLSIDPEVNGVPDDSSVLTLR